jgi:hypothetical protein
VPGQHGHPSGESQEFSERPTVQGRPALGLPAQVRARRGC